MARIPNIRNTHRIIIRTLNIPHIEWAREEIIIFISGLREIIRSGLRVRKSFKIPRFKL